MLVILPCLAIFICHESFFFPAYASAMLMVMVILLKLTASKHYEVSVLRSENVRPNSMNNEWM